MAKVTTFTIRVTTPKKETKYRNNCVIIDGKIVVIISKGVGTPVEKGALGCDDTWLEYPKYEQAYSGLWNNVLMERDGVKAEIKEMLDAQKNTVTLEQIKKYSKYLFHLGENEGGYLVEDTAQVQKNEQELQLREVLNAKTINIVSGIFGLRIIERLPAQIWQIAKPFASYRKGDEDDYSDAEDFGHYDPNKYEITGWFYSYEIIPAFVKIGWKVLYQGIEVKDNNSFVEAIQAVRKKEEELEQQIREKNKEAERLNRELLNVEAEYMTKEQGEAASDLPRILLSYLEWNGPSIYGTGRWLHEDSEYIYIVQNNGHDGDDWSLNNYPTGGAGAIARRIKKTPEIESLFAQMKAFKR